MKIFFKKNKYAIIVFSLLLVWISFAIGIYIKEYGYETIFNAREKIIEKCADIDFVKNPEMVEMCREWVNLDIELDDTFTAYYTVMFSRAMYYFSLIAPILIIVCSVKNFHNDIKYGNIKNKLIREKYSRVMYKSIVNCYKNIFVVILVLILALIMCYFVSGHFDYSNALALGQTTFSEWFFINLPYSYIMYLLVIIFNYILYINIALMFTKYNKNIFVCIIASYLTWLAIDIVAEIIITRYVLFMRFGYWSDDAMNLLAIYTWTPDSWNLIQILFALALAIFSFILVLFSYRKKEVIVIASEK